jgi:polyhydroxyalkanoate synthesis regulator phasin
MRKKLIIAVSAIAAAGIIGASTLGIASAATSNNSGQSIVDKIAQKFNLNKTDVQKVFDENRQEHQAARQQKQADKIAQAVKDGKITQAQADQLTAKLTELQTFRDSLKGKAPAEQRAAMQTKMTELHQWLVDNKIPTNLSGPGGHMGMHRGGAPDADD